MQRRRQQRKIGIIVLFIIVLVAALTMTGQWMWQNYQVHRSCDIFFKAVQARDAVRVAQQYSSGLGISTKYITQLFKYPLDGWEITNISGQPFPLDTPETGEGGLQWNTVSLNLYYALPDNLVQPRGRYRRVKHPKFGECALVPVKVGFAYVPQRSLALVLRDPDLQTGEDWLPPFERLQLLPSEF